VLSERLIVRTGPPAADLATNPTLLAEMARQYGAGTVFVDSLKDAAVGLSSDEVGAGYNRARQHLLAQSVELCELHHDRKAGAGGGASSTVSDIYGSTWLTAGCGSVILLTGEPGDPIIGFRHLKQPVEEIGPFRLLHDQPAGQLTIDFDIDLVELARAAGPDGLTARDAAAAIFEKKNPTRADAEKARRRLDKLADAGVLIRQDGQKGRSKGSAAAWFAP
jgi:replicative DNA helicase